MCCFEIVTMARYSFRKAVRRLGVGMLGAVAVGLGYGSAITQDAIVPDDTPRTSFSRAVPWFLIQVSMEIRGGDVFGSNLLPQNEGF